MSDTDQLKPMAIKSIATRVVDEITEAARISIPKVTVGQLVERVWDHWKSGGTVFPVHREAVQMPSIADTCSAIDAAYKISQFGDGVQLGVKLEANRVVKVMLLDLKVRMRAAYDVTKQKPAPLEVALDHAMERIAAE